MTSTQTRIALIFLSILLGGISVITIARLRNFLANPDAAQYTNISINASLQDLGDDTCITDDCLHEALDYLHYMNASADPCDSFAEFACGMFHKVKEAPETSDGIHTTKTIALETENVFKEIIAEEIHPSDRHYLRTAKIYYKACINTDAINQLGFGPYLSTPYAQEWPTLVGSSWSESPNFTVADVVVRYALVDAIPLFDIYSATALVNSRMYLVGVSPILLWTEIYGYYLGERNSSVVMAYETFLRNLATELGADPQLAADDAKNMIDFEVALSKIHANTDDRRWEVTVTTMASLDQNYSWFGLPQTIRAVYNLVNVTLEDTQAVKIYDDKLTYFSRVEALLKNFTERDIRNMFGFYYAQMQLSETERYRELYFPVEQAKTEAENIEPREDYCKRDMMTIFQHNVGKELMRRTFSEESKSEAEEMIENIRNTMTERLQEVTWIGGTSRANAIEKVQATQVFVGYPDTAFDDDELDKRFEEWQFTEDNLYRNREIVRHQQRLFEYRLITTNRSTGWDWLLGPLKVDVVYGYYYNQLYVMASYLARPFFAKSYQLAHNYGALGAAAGLGFSYTFSPFGSKFDKSGSLTNWWPADERSDYSERVQCFIDQYNNFTGKIGQEGGGEDMKESTTTACSGIELSYRAYRKVIEDRGAEEKRLPGLNLTPNQMFFLAYGQAHCSLTDWIDQTLVNSAEFAQAYDCPIGSPMNPETKCTLF